MTTSLFLSPRVLDPVIQFRDGDRKNPEGYARWACVWRHSRRNAAVSEWVPMELQQLAVDAAAEIIAERTRRRVQP